MEFNGWFSRLENGQNVGLTHDHVIAVLQGQLGTGVLSVQHGIADLDGHGLVLLAVTNSHHGAFLWLLLGGVRNDDSAGGGFFRGGRLDDDAVGQWLDVYRHILNG